MAAFVTLFLQQMVPFTVSREIFVGRQQSYVTSMWSAIGSLLGLGGVLLAIHMRLSSSWLISALAGGPSAALICCGVVLFIREPALRPSLRHIRTSAAALLAKQGVLFLCLQVLSATVLFSDNVIVSQLFGADTVPQYSVPWQMFMVLTVGVNLLLAPLWPAYREALEKGDREWMQRALRRSIYISISLTVAGSSLILLFGSYILKIWVGTGIQPSSLLLASLGVLTVTVQGVTLPLTMLLNGSGILGYQVVWLTLTAVSNIALSIILGRLLGLSGIALGTAIAELAFGVLPSSIYARRVLAGSMPRMSR